MPAASVARRAKRHGRIYVLAGANGAGKSSIGGEALREAGVEFFNPDQAARRIRAAQPGLTPTEANSAAWHQGRRLLETAIAGHLDFAFETTLGGETMTALLERAAETGLEVRIWYAGLDGPALHLERVRRRVAKGGHDIPEADVRRRYDAEPAQPYPAAAAPHRAPAVRQLGRGRSGCRTDACAEALAALALGRIVSPRDFGATPEWAKPILAAAMKRAWAAR